MAVREIRIDDGHEHIVRQSEVAVCAHIIMIIV